MPAIFSRWGVRFAYPENWELDHPELEGGEAVSVASPSGAFWSLSIHSSDTSAEAAAEAILAGLEATYPGLDVEQIEEQLEEYTAVGYDVDFVCLDHINSAQVRVVSSPRGTLAMLWQAEDRDWTQLHQVFAAITTSLLRGLDATHEDEL